MLQPASVARASAESSDLKITLKMFRLLLLESK